MDLPLGPPTRRDFLVHGSAALALGAEAPAAVPSTGSLSAESSDMVFLLEAAGALGAAARYALQRRPLARGSLVRAILQKGFPRGESIFGASSGWLVARDKFTKDGVGIPPLAAARGANPEPGHAPCNLRH